jgi:hypothetical protein
LPHRRTYIDEYTKEQAMRGKEAHTLVDVGADNVEKTGFFCFMSKKKSEGYHRKLRWVKDRFLYAGNSPEQHNLRY